MELKISPAISTVMRIGGFEDADIELLCEPLHERFLDQWCLGVGVKAFQIRFAWGRDWPW